MRDLMWGQPPSAVRRAQLAYSFLVRISANPWQRTSRSCIILRMLGNRTREQWISQYSSSHQNRVNRACHTLGIPTILLSLPVFLASILSIVSGPTL
jgi:lambda repressor-like predicted transcriptional regulator